MADISLNTPSSGRRARELGRAVDKACWIVLLSVIVVVIVGLVRRAHFEHSYAVAVIIALLGAFILVVGLAQQAIAARDLDTWRMMAEWQLRAAHDRTGHNPIAQANSADEDQARYYALLSDMLIEDMMVIHEDEVPHGN